MTKVLLLNNVPRAREISVWMARAAGENAPARLRNCPECGDAIGQGLGWRTPLVPLEAASQIVQRALFSQTK
jgi:hypothetical protein